MTIQAVTVTEGANATLPDGTNAALMPSTAGYVTTIVPAFAATSGDAPTPLADADGIFVQGTTTFENVSASSATVTSVGDDTADTQLLAANANRIGWSVTNDSSAVMYLKFGTSASSTSFTARLAQNERVGQGPLDGLYTGQINAAWASNAGGNARITEW